MVAYTLVTVRATNLHSQFLVITNQELLMPERTKASNTLASLAVFSEMSSKGQDVFQIVSHFIAYTIKAKSLHSFNEAQITLEVNRLFDFELPIGVINTALHRIKGIIRNQGNYIIDKHFDIETEDIDQSLTANHKNHQQLVNRLIQFIENHKKINLDENQKDDVLKCFSNYLQDDLALNNYSDLISAFILANTKDNEFNNQLNSIREGFIVYTGIRHTSDASLLNAKIRNCSIYIDSEILFHATGLHGELYRKIFNEFNTLINKARGKGSTINLYFGTEAKKEVDSVFEHARQLVSRPQAGFRKTALTSILNGSSNITDITRKRVEFYGELQRLGIHEDPYNSYFSPENEKYNIADAATIDKVHTELEEQELETPKSNGKYRSKPEIEDALIAISKIITLRKGRFQGDYFESGYLLVTGKSKVMLVDRTKTILNMSGTHCALDLFRITSILWCKLSIGFASPSLPTSLQVVTRAQVLFSRRVSDKITQEYEKLQGQVKIGKLRIIDASVMISELRLISKSAEDFDEISYASALELLSEDDYQYHIKEHALLLSELDQAKREKIELTQTILQDKINKNNDNILKHEKIKKIALKTSKRTILLFKILITEIIIAPFMIVWLFSNNQTWSAFKPIFELIKYGYSFIILLCWIWKVPYHKLQHLYHLIIRLIRKYTLIKLNYNFKAHQAEKFKLQSLQDELATL